MKIELLDVLKNDFVRKKLIKLFLNAPQMGCIFSEVKLLGNTG